MNTVRKCFGLLVLIAVIAGNAGCGGSEPTAGTVGNTGQMKAPPMPSNKARPNAND
jgi:hypothetical protein